MKRPFLIMLSAIIAVLVIAAVSSPSWTAISVYKAKRIYTYSNRVDTSATINTLGAESVELATSTAGTDSLRMLIAVDYRIGSTWILNAVTDSIKYGDATTGTKAKGTIVVRPSAATTLPGSATIRIRNTIVPYPGADSTGVGSYTQNVVIH